MTYLIIRDRQRFVQVWVDGEKGLAKPLPEPECIPAQLQKAIGHAAWELNFDNLTASYPTHGWCYLGSGDFIAAAHQHVNDWAIWMLLKAMLIQALPSEVKVGMATKQKAGRAEKEYRRLCMQREASL